MDKKLSIGKCVEFYRMNRLRLLNLHFEKKKKYYCFFADYQIQLFVVFVLFIVIY
jgi:hypothetical protein